MRRAAIAILTTALAAMPGCVSVNRSDINTSMSDDTIERIVRDRLSSAQSVEDSLRLAHGMTDWDKVRFQWRHPGNIVPWDESASQLLLPLAKRTQKRGLFPMPFAAVEEIVVTLADDGSVIGLERREPVRRGRSDHWVLLPCGSLDTQWAALDPWRDPAALGINLSGTSVLLEPGRTARFDFDGVSEGIRYFAVNVMAYGTSTDRFPILTPVRDFEYVIADQWASGGRPLGLAGSWVADEHDWYGFNRFPEVASAFCFAIIVEPGARAEFEITLAEEGGS